MRFASGRPPGPRAVRGVLLAVTCAAMAAGVMAGTASTATASLTTPATSTAEPLSAPPFFAGIVAEPGPNGKFVDVVKTFSSATGDPAGTLMVPPSQDLFALARLGDDHSFVAGSFDRDACITHLWRFTIDTAGQPGPLTPLAVPQFSGAIEELTSSADGTAVAFNVAGCKGDFQTWFIDLSPGSTGQITRWGNPGGAGSLSLTADGSVLGFTLSPDIDNDVPNQAWTMPTDAPAGDLLSHAHQVPGLGTNAERAVLSPSGDQLWIEAQPSSGRGPVTLSLVTTSTGALVRQVTRLNDGGKDLAFPALALDTAGQHMLAYGQNPGPGHADAEEIDLSSGQTLTFTITDPVVEGPLTTFAW